MIRVVKRDATEAADPKNRVSAARRKVFPPEVRFVINPNGFRKSVWDGVIAVVLFYAGLCTPFLVAFVATCAPRRSCVTFWVDSFCDALFLVDIFVNLNTAYFERDHQRDARVAFFFSSRGGSTRPMCLGGGSSRARGSRGATS